MESMRVKLEEYFEVEIILERYERKRDKVLLEIDWELKGKEVEITVEDSIYILKLLVDGDAFCKQGVEIMNEDNKII